MSYSSLFLIKPDTSFGQRSNYSNSWLFAPVSWGLQLNSYITDEIRTPHGFAKSLINSQDANRLFSLANDELNNSTCTADRIVWELSNQQIFSTKDKDVVSECIFEYYENHKNDTLLYDKENPLQQEHIEERWKQIAIDIRNINTDEYKYFVFKCTSVDDGVERWFQYYDEEQDESFDSTLKEHLERYSNDVVERVHIEDGNIIGFTSSRMDAFEL